MNLTITKISRKPVNTKYGQKNKIGILTQEYGEQWINGWENASTSTWAVGQVVQAEVYQDPQYGLQFKTVSAPRMAPAPAPTPTAAKVVQAYKQVDQDEKWNKISFGKCKHAYLLEAYKTGKNLAEAEAEAEKWARVSMRILPAQPTQTEQPEPAEDLPVIDADADADEIQIDKIPF